MKDTQQRLLAGGLLMAACASADASWLHRSHHVAPHPAPVANPAPALSATPVVSRDYGKVQEDRMGPASRLVPNADALLASEEELDRLRLEHDDLMSRIQSLQQQLRDEQQLLKLKQKQIHELETELKTQNAQ